jgi:hypothetical protein
MTKNSFVFKKSNQSQWKSIAVECYRSIQSCLGGHKEFQIEIKPYSFRSLNALRAYWVLINSIVKWDKDNHGFKSDIWDEWFKREAGLIEVIDLMTFWEVKYNKYNISHPTQLNTDYQAYNDEKCIVLGKRYIEKTKSISNKGDVTKEEMERLLNCVLKFGAKNEVPNCFIDDGEKEKMLSKFNIKE